jgi:preprotein translocase subunit SecG
VLAVPLFAKISTLGWVLNGVLIALSLILMFIVLIQRGKGGGLAGAFGGAGGSSAFGSRAGDAFTKITLYTAGIWVLIVMFAVKWTAEKAPNDSTKVVDVQPAEKPPGDPGT